MFVDIVKVFIL